VHRPEGILWSVKFSKTRGAVELIKREAAIQKKLKDLLILEFRESPPGMFGPKTTIVTEVAGNGSLVRHLPSGRGTKTCQLRGPNRIAKIIVGIVLAI
jgi:hypothetical protein